MRKVAFASSSPAQTQSCPLTVFEVIPVPVIRISPTMCTLSLIHIYPAVSRITIVVNGNEATVEQVEKQLNKLIDVIKLRRLPDHSTISRELMLIKVHCTEKTRSDIMDIVRVMEAKVSDISKTTPVSYTHLLCMES